MAGAVKPAQTLRALARVKGNQIILGKNLGMTNSRVIFHGQNNLLCLEDGVKLVNSRIVFYGSDCAVIIRNSGRETKVDLSVYNRSAVYIGKNCYFNGTLCLSASEGQNVVIGSHCLISLGNWIRTADPHLIYSCSDHQRLNPSRSVWVGDHVWLGQDAMLLKGTCVGSGSIIGAKSLVTGKRIPSNTTWGGVPARQLGSGVFWRGDSVHAWTPEKTLANQTHRGDEFIFAPDEGTLETAREDEALKACPTAREKYDYLMALFAGDRKNRLALE